MERGILARAMSVSDARLLADVLGNEHILGEYSVEELMRLATMRHDLLVRIRKAERMEQAEREGAALV